MAPPTAVAIVAVPMVARRRRRRDPDAGGAARGLYRKDTTVFSSQGLKCKYLARSRLQP
jgi:hypothetical protein